ncbi:MAG TPA: S46 family peptidase, partial [Thermoanaerobaculia bacterium]|nr:S46 family peptidase [Thermoanaerobaculia bacterium]
MKRLFPLILIMAVTPLFSGEGMWMPRQIPQLAEELEAQGLEIDPAALADLTGYPMGAIVSLGGCSASFVSPEGLVVTNHHCAFGSIQYNSSEERDLITDGFLAMNKDRELPAAPGSRVYVTTGMTNVTEQVLGDIPSSASDLQRYQIVDRREKEIVAKCEEEGGVRCRVASFFGGMEYQLIEQMEIRDVRLVYAPGRGIGEFGGDIDNWMWPRHTGDWSFFRAYVGPDGRPADHAADNVPYRPRHVLSVSTEGVDPGDLV